MPIKFMVFDKTDKMFRFYTGIFGHFKPFREMSTFPQYESCPKINDLSRPYQFTGLYDINKKEAYSGHIIEWDGWKRIIIYNPKMARYELTNNINHDEDFQIPINFKFEIMGHIAEEKN